MKNIIMIVTDTFRYDNLAPNSPLGTRTPELDRFKQRAVAVENFYTGSFPTVPHRNDLATGTLGWPHYGWRSIKKCSPNHMAALFGEHGYATQLIADCPHLFNTS